MLPPYEVSAPKSRGEITQRSRSFSRAVGSQLGWVFQAEQNRPTSKGRAVLLPQLRVSHRIEEHLDGVLHLVDHLSRPGLDLLAVHGPEDVRKLNVLDPDPHSEHTERPLVLLPP